MVRADVARRIGGTAPLAVAALADGLGLPPKALVAGYWPLGDEIDARPLMLALAGAGHDLALPVVVGSDSPLEFRRWAPGDDLIDGPHGTLRPTDTAPAVDPAVLLVPLLAFDGAFFRLGYGGGYYDRTLARLRRTGPVTAIGLAFSVQQVPALPLGPWDQPLDMVVTERGVLTRERV